MPTLSFLVKKICQNDKPSSGGFCHIFLPFVPCILPLLRSCSEKSAATISNMAVNNKEVGNVQLTEAPDVFDDSISHVPDKYKGTDADRHDMNILGKKQVLRVREC